MHIIVVATKLVTDAHEKSKVLQWICKKRRININALGNATMKFYPMVSECLLQSNRLLPIRPFNFERS